MEGADEDSVADGKGDWGDWGVWVVVVVAA